MAGPEDVIAEHMRCKRECTEPCCTRCGNTRFFSYWGQPAYVSNFCANCGARMAFFGVF